MSGTPTLKIKLRLSGASTKSPAASPKIDVNDSKPSPASSAASTGTKREASEPAQQATPKRSRGGPGSRSKKNVDSATSTPQPKAAADLAYV
jgi:hypothetical protein